MIRWVIFDFFPNLGVRRFFNFDEGPKWFLWNILKWCSNICTIQTIGASDLIYTLKYSQTFLFHDPRGNFWFFPNSGTRELLNFDKGPKRYSETWGGVVQIYRIQTIGAKDVICALIYLLHDPVSNFQFFLNSRVWGL